MTASALRSRPLVLLILGVLLAAGCDATARAEMSAAQRETVLAEAQAAYDRGVAAIRSDPEAAREAFRESAQRFRQLVDDGVENGSLHYNLGNAFFQAGEPGRAILHYRWAETLIPGDAKLRQNLATARSQRRTRIEPSGGRALADAVLGWHARTSVGGRYNVFAVAYVGFWGLLVALIFRPSASLRWIAAVLAVAWLAAGLSVGVDLLQRGEQRVGVVLVDDVVVRKGNGEGFEPVFEEALHEGAEFELRDRRTGWLHIEVPDGSAGWIPESAAALVG